MEGVTPKDDNIDKIYLYFWDCVHNNLDVHFMFETHQGEGEVNTGVDESLVLYVLSLISFFYKYVRF